MRAMPGKRKLRFGLTLGALCVWLATPAWSQTVVSTPYAEIAAIAERELAEDGVGGLSLGFVHHADLVYEAAFGFADMESKRKASPDSVYRIGSITKQFTGLALLRLAHEGELHLSDPVERYVPEVARIQNRFDNAPPITLIQLATMTSGLSREPEDLPTYLVGPASQWFDVVLKALPKVRYDFEPDTRYQYSNIGYAILGGALERASQRNYIMMVRTELLLPLGMVDTDFVPQTHFQTRIATGYAVRDGVLDSETPAREHEGRGYKVPNGALYSTVADLARFISFQLGHGPDSVIPAAVLEENLSLASSAQDGLSSGYGIGFSVVRRGELVIYGHGGSVAGYRAAAYFDRATGLGVVLLRNVTGGALNVTELSYRMLEELVASAGVESTN